VVHPVSIVLPCPLDVDAYVKHGRELEVPRPPCPLCSGPIWPTSPPTTPRRPPFAWTWSRGPTLTWIIGLRYGSPLRDRAGASRTPSWSSRHRRPGRPRRGVELPVQLPPQLGAVHAEPAGGADQPADCLLDLPSALDPHHVWADRRDRDAAPDRGDHPALATELGVGADHRVWARPRSRASWRTDGRGRRPAAGRRRSGGGVARRSARTATLMPPGRGREGALSLRHRPPSPVGEAPAEPGR
jgi:hypothetical protein